MNSSKNAVEELCRHNIRAENTDYGFRIAHDDVVDRSFAECGMDNDSSISISLTSEDGPPVSWFFRKDYQEIADLIIAAFEKAGGPEAQPSAIIAAMKTVDKDYDDTELEKMTSAFLAEIENE